MELKIVGIYHKLLVDKVAKVAKVPYLQHINYWFKSPCCCIGDIIFRVCVP